MIYNKIELAFHNVYKWNSERKIIPFQHSIFEKISIELWYKILNSLSFMDVKRFSLSSRYANSIVHLYAKAKFQRMAHAKKPIIFYNIAKANVVQSSVSLNLSTVGTSEFDILELFQFCLSDNSLYYIDLFDKFCCKRNSNNSFSNLLMNTYQYNASNNAEYLTKSTYPNFYHTTQFSKFYSDILIESIKELILFYQNDSRSIYNNLYFMFNLTKEDEVMKNIKMNFDDDNYTFNIEIKKEDETLPINISLSLSDVNNMTLPNVFKTFMHLIQNSCPFVNDGFVYQMLIPSQFCPTSDISIHALHDEKCFKLIIQGYVAKVISEIIKSNTKCESFTTMDIDNNDNNNENNENIVENDNNENNNENNNDENNNNENNNDENNNNENNNGENNHNENNNNENNDNNNEANNNNSNNNNNVEEIKWPLDLYYVDPEESEEVKYKKETINWFEWLPFIGIHEQTERRLQNFINNNENPNANQDQEIRNQNEALGQQLNLNMEVAFNQAAVNAVREDNMDRERNLVSVTRSSTVYININSKSKFYGAIGHLYKGRFEIITDSLSEFVKARAIWNFMRWCGGKHEMLRNYLWPMLAEKEGCLYGFRRREVLSGACRGSLDDLAFSINNISYTSFIEFFRMLFETKSLDYELLV